MDQYLIYLRKSRKDRDLEQQTGNYDTLQRHRAALLSLAKQRGYSISHIYEEVVSGDSISERPEMQKLLAAVETGAFAGVLVMEVPRLARGNTRDQGIVAETFQYSGTLIITPDKTYDPSDEADEEYFEFGLFMSRREYKAINRRLQRGRLASFNEGKYIAGAAPYGYRKIKLPKQKGYSLEVDPEAADVVREIYRLYTIGDAQPDGRTVPVGSYQIANILNARGIPSPGGTAWSASGVRDILKNPTYAGYIRWAYRPATKKVVDGQVCVTYPISKNASQQKGLHEPIITEQTWTAANTAMSGRSHAPVPSRTEMSNPLAGLLYCSVCGRSLVRLPNGSHGSAMVICPTPKCATVGSRLDVVETALLTSLGEWLSAYQVQLDEQSRSDVSEDKRRPIQKQLEKAKKQLSSLQNQRGNLFDLLEQKIYTKEIFLERSNVLAERIANIEKEIQSLQDHLLALDDAAQARETIIPRIQNVLDVYDTLEIPKEKNQLLKSVIDRVIYHKSTGGRWGQSDMQLFLYPKLPPQK